MVRDPSEATSKVRTLGYGKVRLRRFCEISTAVKLINFPRFQKIFFFQIKGIDEF